MVLRAVGAMLKANTSLRTLLLHLASNTNLIEAASPIIEEALKTNSTLESLTFVRREPVSRFEPTETFGKVFQEDNTTLRYLHIYDAKQVRGNAKPSTTRVPLPDKTDFYLKLNKLGRRLLMERPKESTWVRIISALRDHTDVAYYYLRQYPDLVNPHRSGPRVQVRESLEPVRKRRKLLPSGQSVHNQRFCQMLARQCCSG